MANQHGSNRRNNIPNFEQIMNTYSESNPSTRFCNDELRHLESYDKYIRFMGKWSGKEKIKWTDLQKDHFRKTMKTTITNRIIKLEREKGLHDRYNSERGQNNEDLLTHTLQCTLQILGLKSWDQAYYWFNSMFGPDMDIHMFLLLEMDENLVDIGHIVPVHYAKIEMRSNRNWYKKYFHYTNLGPQFAFMNSYMGSMCLYPMKWVDDNDGTRWVQDEDSTHMSDVRVQYEERSSMMLVAMSVIREQILGEDNVPRKFHNASVYKFFEVKYDRYFIE